MCKVLYSSRHFNVICICQGWLTKNGAINLRCLQTLLSQLGQNEENIFKMRRTSQLIKYGNDVKVWFSSLLILKHITVRERRRRDSVLMETTNLRNQLVSFLPFLRM